MMLLDADFLAAINAVETRPLHLVEIGFSPVLRLATREGVLWDGHDWVADRVVLVEGLSQDGKGAAAATLTIGNTDSLMSALLLNQQWRDRSIAIWSAWLDGAGTAHVMASMVGVGGGARCTSTEMVGEVLNGQSACSHAPRTLIRTAIGWPPPKPDGYKFNWNGQIYVLTGRGGRRAGAQPDTPAPKRPAPGIGV